MTYTTAYHFSHGQSVDVARNKRGRHAPSSRHVMCLVSPSPAVPCVTNTHPRTLITLSHSHTRTQSDMKTQTGEATRRDQRINMVVLTSEWQVRGGRGSGIPRQRWQRGNHSRCCFRVFAGCCDEILRQKGGPKSCKLSLYFVCCVRFQFVSLCLLTWHQH